MLKASLLMTATLLALLTSAPRLLYAAQRMEEWRKIAQAQDLRDAGTLHEFLRDSLGEARARACLAAGSVQDTAFIPHLVSLLRDERPDVRRGSAFALGQLNYVLSSSQRLLTSSSLLEAFSREQDSTVLLRVVEALGKTGDQLSLDRLLGTANSSSGASGRSEIALSIGRYAYRGITNQEAAGFAVVQLRELQPLHKWKAAYALMRIGNDSILRPYRGEMITAIREADPDTRIFLASGIGAPAESENNFLSFIREEPDWRVRVSFLRSLSRGLKAYRKETLDVVFEAIADSNEHISLAGLSVLRSLHDATLELKGDEAWSVLEIVVREDAGRFTDRQKEEAANSIVALFPGKGLGVIREEFEHGRLQEKTYVRCLGVEKSPESLQLLPPFVHDESPVTQRIALESLQNHISAANVELIRQSMVEALRSDDIAVLTTAAAGLGDSLLMNPSSVGPLLEALARLRLPDDIEPMVAIVQTLGSLKADSAVGVLTAFLNGEDRILAVESATSLKKITGKSYDPVMPRPISPGHVDNDWNAIQWILEHPHCELLTTRGRIVIEMFPDESPFTCLNFFRLMQKEFFDSLIFHRVVANFVVQGGDPRGDGWGGPGYSIRSEFGFRSYERGMVGVASAGKDTEGCQFFITHSRQPHLDGRYTIFGRVVDGMEVVDQIQVGDLIHEFRMLEGD